MDRTKIRYDAPYLDDEEREIMETMDMAITKGDVIIPTKDEVVHLNKQWQQDLQLSQQRKSVTFRLQRRDISRLKTLAQKKGIPYQTLVSSVLHQFANGDIIER